MIMIATVQEVEDSRLLVNDRETSQHIIVHTNRANCFSPGDRVKIWYSGAMTSSIPPQISAIRIERISRCRCC